MTDTRVQLLVDVTQYVSWPATSGVQRVLRHLGENWRGETVAASFGFLEKRRYVAGPIAALGSVIASTFRESDRTAHADAVRGALREAASLTFASSDVENRFDAYLLPEPSLRENDLIVAKRLLGSRNTTPFFIYYDALPLTHPKFFPRDAQREVRLLDYNGTVMRSDHVAFISSNTRTFFEERVARRPIGHATVARPGADGLERVPPCMPDRPTFTMIGTIEPRKRHLVVLQAFEQLWATGHDFRLVVAGSPSKTFVVEELEAHIQSPYVMWIEQPADGEVATLLSRSSALIFTSEAEGYGLPPLEALAVGCPTIVSANLPALEGIPADGQVRLDTIDATSVASAVQALADDNTNKAYRSALTRLSLPTWEQFATEIEDWIASALKVGEDGDDRNRDAA
jgi:glycosyltransferase involved in cell wall biosynthesis